MIENGQIARIVKDKRYGFISNGKQDFFFHRDDVGVELWNEIVDKFDSGDIHVTFERWQAPKGMRAVNIKLI